MKWVLKEPSYGDMIRVHIGSIYHYGIFVSDSEIIQFGLAPSARPNVKPCDVEVCTSDIDTFLCGGFLEVGEPDKKEEKSCRSPEDIVSTARARLGEKNYSIIYNNCEHFAYECVMGKKYCSQTDNVRELFRSFPIVDVYVTGISYDAPLSPIYPKDVFKEICECTDKKLSYQKFFEWKLLEYALERTFGKKLKKLNFERNECGEWKCDICEFALTHTDDAVAVAVSRKPVKIALNDPLLDEYNWTHETVINDKKFLISVKSETPDKIRFYQNIQLKY